jgi:hypothetical protein
MGQAIDHHGHGYLAIWQSAAEIVPCEICMMRLAMGAGF